MKFTATKENLLFGVQAVQKAVSSKNTLPILSGIKIEARGNLLYFSATDLEMGIECHVPVEIIEEGATVVPARHFAEIVRKLPDSKIMVIQEEASTSLFINYEKSELSLKTFSPEEFPTLPDVKGQYEIAVNTGILRSMIRQTVFAASTDEARPLFTGILCEINQGKLILVATDTHRLALRQGVPQGVPEENISFIVPAKILLELARLMHDEEEVCYLSLNKNQASFMFSNLRMICRLMEGQFPNYRQVIPNTYTSKIYANTRIFQDAVERISLFALEKDSSYTVNILIEDNELTISSRSQLGQGYEKISIQCEGEPLSISFNARYITDVLKNLDAEIMTLEFTGPVSPGIVRSAENENFLYLILPIRQ